MICTWLALGSGLPGSGLKVSDIALHLFAFSYLTVALRIAHISLFWLLVVVLMLAYGGFIEVVQGYLPARQSEWKDFAVDVVGTVSYTHLRAHETVLDLTRSRMPSSA